MCGVQYEGGVQGERIMIALYVLGVAVLCVLSFVAGVYLACVAGGREYSKRIQKFADHVGELSDDEKRLLTFVFGDIFDWEKRP